MGGVASFRSKTGAITKRVAGRKQRGVTILA